MKKMLRAAGSLLMVVLLLFTVLPVAHADGTVTYMGHSSKFFFAPGSSGYPTDLFDQLKNVMPGDSLSQRITVVNKASNNVKVKLYMRALGAETGSEDFLSKLNLTVVQNGSTELFDAPADQKATLGDWVYLGLLYSGGSVDLDLTLDVPLALDDSYQDAVGVLNWEFRADEYPCEPGDPQPPATGGSNLIWPSVCVIAVAAAVYVIVKKKEKSEES